MQAVAEAPLTQFNDSARSRLIELKQYRLALPTMPQAAPWGLTQAGGQQESRQCRQAEGQLLSPKARTMVDPLQSACGCGTTPSSSCNKVDASEALLSIWEYFLMSHGTPLRTCSLHCSACMGTC